MAHAGRVRGKRPKFVQPHLSARDLHLLIPRVLALPRKTGPCHTAHPTCLAREIQARCVAASLSHRPPHASIAGNAPGRWSIRAPTALHGHTAAAAARGCSAHAAPCPSLAPAGHSLWQRQEQQQPPCRAGSPSQRCSSCRWPGWQQAGWRGRPAGSGSRRQPLAHAAHPPRACLLRPLGPAEHCHYAPQCCAARFFVFPGGIAGQSQVQHLIA